MSAPNSPGGTSNVSASGSVATTTVAPAAWARSASARWSSMRPSVAGYWSRIPQRSWDSKSIASTDPTWSSIPSASARVRNTPSVCGWQSAAAKKPRLRLARSQRTSRAPRRRRRFVEQGRVGERQAREVRDQRLEVQQRFEPALRDLGLVGGVLGVPTRIFEDVALDHRRNDRVGVTHSDARSDHAVFGRDLPELFDQLKLAGRRAFEAGQFQRLGEADRRGHGVVGEFVEARVAEALEHLGDLAVARADVAALEDVARFEQRSRRFSWESCCCRRFVRRSPGLPS